MCAKDNFYFLGAISRKTGWKYAVRTMNHGVGFRTALIRPSIKYEPRISPRFILRNTYLYPSV